jgi:inorganic phosphate transporter, PiT family
MLPTLLFLAVAALAFTNGANANFKGVATLYASVVLSRQQAVWLGTLGTAAGSLTSVFLGSALLSTFSGRGLLPDAALTMSFLCSVALGAALTSFVATRLGFPVSTTHALVGAIIGAGLASGASVHLDRLGALVLLPLLLSPVSGAVLAFTLLMLTGWIWKKVPPSGRAGNGVHVLFAGLASFARGWNDTPKMAALLLVLVQDQVWLASMFVAVGIFLGGWLDSRKVAETLGKRVAVINPAEGITACVSTASLVTAASLLGWPVSTTHVSVGSMLGMGVRNRQAVWLGVGEIALAWITTVPVAAALAALCRWLIPG